MPGGNRQGPNNMGPMTGRAAGFCGGNNAPGYVNTFGGRGMRNGGNRFFGGGRGNRNMFYATGQPGFIRNSNFQNQGGEINSEQEIENLKNQSEYLQGTIDSLQKRIDELEKSDG